MTRLDRRSHSLSHDEAKRIWDAAVSAYCKAKPPNRFITIHFGKLGTTNPRLAIGPFLKRAGDWLRKRSGESPAYIWVIENPRPKDFGEGGLNGHILIHVPHLLIPEFEKLLEGWLVGAGKKAPQGAIYSKAVKHSGPKAKREAYLRHGLMGLLRYMSKGIEPGSRFFMGISPIDQGEIRGKRSGYSESLGVSRRYPRLTFPGHPGCWIGGSESRRRHLIKHLCPELLGLPPESDCEGQPGSVFGTGLAD